MSTLSTIETLLAAGTLREFVPRVLPHETARRRIVMLPRLHGELHANPRRVTQRDCLSAARTHLDRFVLGYRVDNARFMRELERCPQGIWKFHVRKLIVKDQIRVFGVFAGPNLFFATRTCETGTTLPATNEDGLTR